MAEFILKDWYGREQTFNHDKIFLRNEAGELVQFTEGKGGAVLENLEVTENGTYTPAEGVDGFGSVTVNVDPTKKTVLKENAFGGFAPDSTMNGVYANDYVSPAEFVLNNGEKYNVKWDEAEYECTAVSFEMNGWKLTAIGNGVLLGLPGNGEPFLIIYNATVDSTQFYSTDTDDTHTISIWKKVSAGSSDELRHVTFMNHNGQEEYGKKAVAVGDDCADPITRGIFNTPTRESDAQNNYAYNGWAEEPNGAAVSGWNKAILEDKTVYASFNSSTRYYTITYYDGDGVAVLKTESKAYGTTPSYKPEKDGYKFNGWVPAIETVTGDANYVAQWEESVAFADTSWEKIAEKSADGTASQTWKVGDTKVIPINYSDGTTENITVAIADFNHDDLADGSGKAGISLVCMTLPSKTTLWGSVNDVYYYNPSYPTRCLVHTLLMDTILPSLPTDLQNVIKTVNKKYDNSKSTGDTTLAVAGFDLWALSLDELGATAGGMGYSTTNFSELGTRYPLFAKVSQIGTTAQTMPKCADVNGTYVTYFTRHIKRTGSLAACSISQNGTLATREYTNYKNIESNVRFGFCV